MQKENKNIAMFHEKSICVVFRILRLYTHTCSTGEKTGMDGVQLFMPKKNRKNVKEVIAF